MKEAYESLKAFNDESSKKIHDLQKRIHNLDMTLNEERRLKEML